MKSLFLLFLTIAVTNSGMSQNRIEYSINDNWKFHVGGLAFAQRANVKGYPIPVDELWETVSIPHTWNADDPFDDSESYRRGIGWYRKNISLSENLKNKKIYLHFEGANQVADVYVNGAFAGSHKGGYTAFTIDISKHSRFGEENLIAVKVDNSHSNVIPPLSVGFGLYGGIYRDVWLVATDLVHFGMHNHGSSSVFVSTPEVSKTKASVSVKTDVVNETAKDVTVTVLQIVSDAEGNEITRTKNSKEMPPMDHFSFTSETMNVDNPKLWSPENPVLYTVKSQVLIDGKIVDEVVSPLGFRWYEFDSQNGFSLNGEKYKLKGTNRHQDKQGLGSALPNSQHVADLKMIKEMGANFLRLAHYPQDPVVLKTADKIGLLIWEEIPVVNYVNPTDEFKKNTQNMLKEMIRQHYNHPSIILWGSSNEIFLWDELGKRSSRIENDGYMKWTKDFVSFLNNTIHMEDPNRSSTLAIHGSSDYDKAQITSIPDVLSINLYSGWYSGTFPGFGRSLDKRKENYPEQALFVSEYGAGSDSRINGVNPKRFDFTGNWARMFHESYLEQINDRSWLAGSAIWNQFDFSQPHTGGSIQHRNQKGLQTWDRKKKDVYYFYKANWSDDPVLYIASREWTMRNGFINNDGTYLTHLPKTQNVEIYTNLEKIELFQNGKSLGQKKSNKQGKLVWQVNFIEGENRILVRGKNGKAVIEDFLSINFKTHSSKLKTGESLHINLGFNAEFTDENNTIWLPDQEYTKGSYGYKSGKSYMANKDLIVVNAKHRPILFNYSLEELDTYNVDVPDGNYLVELHFSETHHFMKGDRIFDIKVNEIPVFKNLDMVQEYGFLNAFSKTILVEARDSKGIEIMMKAIKGNTSISAIQIKKID